MKTILLAILGAIKLVTDAFGIQLLDDASMNAIANGVAAVVVVAGIALDNIARYRKKKEAKLNPPQE